MKNNNSAVIKLLTVRRLKSSKRTNFFILMAIALTTLLLASVFSIGMSLLKSVQMQEVRLMGTVAHAAVPRPDASHLEKLRQLPYVKTVGTGNNVALIKNTPPMGDMKLSLHYFDRTEWEKLRAPAYADITGSYPLEEDEIMVPLWVLERLGISKPSIGMEIPLSYYSDSESSNNPINRVFRLSGWFTSYMYIRSGNVDSILVSEALSQSCRKTVEADGAASVVFDDSTKVSQYCTQLEKDLDLTENQRVKPVPSYDTDKSAVSSSVIALSIIIAFLVFTGYLLIYNVLYISVSRDVRFYGLLKTLGTTPRQLRRIVLGQILRLCVLGIPVGAAASLLLSVIAVPQFITKLAGTSTGAVVSFSPLIYIGAAVFALLTALLGAFKPARKAAGISPVEAQKFTGIIPDKSRVYSSANGKPYKMAVRNIFRDRKRAVVVFLSLFLGITTFTAVITLVTSMDTDNYVASYMESDFVLKNNTVLGFEEAPKQKFDDVFIKKLMSLPGFESLRVTTNGWTALQYSHDEFWEYAADFIKRNNAEGLTEQTIQERFQGLIGGIDRKAVEELNKTLEQPIDVDAFDRGELALLATNNPELFHKVRQLTLSPIMVNTGSGGIRKVPGGMAFKLPLGGFVPLFFEDMGSSLAPTVFVSNTLMKEMFEDPVISKVNIDVAKGYDGQALDALKQLTGKDYEISLLSKLEAQEEMRGAKMILYILGGGIALILALIGILNFVNVMSVGIMVRRQELATLECVGMSRRQVRKMLINEGLGYALITLSLVLTLGNALTLVIFRLFQKQATYVVFTYPFAPVLLASLAVLAICILTPEMEYRSIYRSTVVERLREAE